MTDGGLEPGCYDSRARALPPALSRSVICVCVVSALCCPLQLCCEEEASEADLYVVMK